MGHGRETRSQHAPRNHLQARARSMARTRRTPLGPLPLMRRLVDTVKRACPRCGAVNCQAHAPQQPAKPSNGWSPNRDRAQQARFRKALIARADGRCEDCGATQDLRACHIIPLAHGGGYALANGRLRCASCDKATDQYAR